MFSNFLIEKACDKSHRLYIYSKKHRRQGLSSDLVTAAADKLPHQGGLRNIVGGNR